MFKPKQKHAAIAYKLYFEELDGADILHKLAARRKRSDDDIIRR